MKIGVLGPLEIAHSDEPPVRLTSHRQGSVLAILIIAAGRAVAAERLIEDVWGDDLPANPSNTLHNNVAQLRKLLEPGRARSDPPAVLVSVGSGYCLDLTGHELDVDAFDRLVDEARRLHTAGRSIEALAEVERALTLWRGPAYADFLADDFADGERERLTERHIEADELRIDCLLATDGAEAVIPDLEALLVDHPYRENLWARLMTALYQAGRRAEALRAYQRALSTLGDELGLEASPALRALEQQILEHDPDLAPSGVGDIPNNLPVATSSLIGRQAELELAADAVVEHRLVTLLGPGGAGKTRLALEVADRLATAGTSTGFTDGIWLVELDDQRDPTLLEPSIGAVLRMPESADRAVRDTLVAYLRDRSVLLILDSCEHLIDHVAPLVSDLITRCRQLTVLATSQAALRVSGEQRLTVPPLGLPGQDQALFAELDAAPAVQLFVERSREIDPDRTFDDADLHAIANIVEELDGMPLAIELAAARTDSLSPTEIARLLSDRFDLLTTGPSDAPGRQRTLGSTVAWSYNLLAPEEQRFFAQLAVFAGGFDIEAAARLTGRSETETSDLAGRLIALSFLRRQADRNRASRFRLLETLRQYGLGLLDDRADHRDELARRHGELFAERATVLDERLSGPEQLPALDAFRADEDNFRSAMTWSLEAGIDDPAARHLGLRIAARLGRFWDWTGALAEANTWLTRFVEAIGDDQTAEDLPLLLLWESYIASELGERGRAQRSIDRAIDIATEHGDRATLSNLHAARVLHARLAGDTDAAGYHNELARTYATELGDRWLEAYADNQDALTRLARGEAEAALVLAERSRRRFEALGDRRGTGWALTALAQAEGARGDHEASLTEARRANQISREAADGRNAAWAAGLAADAARALGRHEEADEHDDEAASLLAERGVRLVAWG